MSALPARGEPSASSRHRPGLPVLLMWGLFLLLLGPQFLGAALLGASFAQRTGTAMAGVLLVVAAVYLLSGPGAVFVASAVGATSGVHYRRRGFTIEGCAIGAAAGVLAACLASLWGEGLMALRITDLEFLLPFYSSAGIPLREARAALDLMVYLSPGMGALQTVLGAIAACIVMEIAAARKAGRAIRALPDFRPGMGAAYITIALLALNLLALNARVPTLFV
ncbi:hypothetical protein JW921_08100, partial [Candidatus Fermentibacterales bacterium]|nr:hypothetical protein [Candidatus Fermentibacterales bacterium]